MELEVRRSSCSEAPASSQLTVEIDASLTKSHSDAELLPSSKHSPLPLSSGNPLGDGLAKASSRFVVSRVSEEQLARSVASANADSAEKHSNAPASAHGHHKSFFAKGQTSVAPTSGNSSDQPPPKTPNGTEDPTKPADPSTVPKPEATAEREPFIILGVCAMGKKAKSKYMTEILTRITSEFEQIKTLIFNEAMILNEPVESWPRCDALISFYSGRFPLDKAAQYAKLRQPFLINDLQMQYAIQDRRKVYEILKASGVELPRYAILDRSSSNPADYALEEYEDYIVVRGQQFNKPFVEKPISADDHNIYIYYPVSAGSGSQRLFRKIGTRSSVYSNENKIRATGSYIYEEFMPTDGTDVKVYTVGPEYAHAEARKSPALDGVVERDKEGKELRFPIILNNIEKLISRRVCIAFKQTVCGFDLLRANGRSYVCDVNGFSFVKNSMFYYNDFAKILANIILRRLAPEMHIHWSMPYQLEDPPIVPTTIGRMMELRCMVAVIRHGDRTPKQKMKMELRHPKFLAMYKQFGGKFDNDGREIKLKRPSQLQEVLNVVRDLLVNHRSEGPIKEARPKLIQLKSVLEMYGHFSGINRKCQIKYQALDPSLPQPEDAAAVADAENATGHLVLIMKWGGELTPLGKYQSEQLGQMFRCMYPGSNGASAKKGHGLLRLHSTFRHDLKIYASDEGRVQTTAAAFAKGLLALEGELTPILVQMVKSANTNGLLDSDVAAQDFEKSVKKRLKAILKQNRDFDQSDMEALNPTASTAITAAMDSVKNPVAACLEIHKGIKALNIAIREKMTAQSAELPTLYTGESWELLQRRWGKLEKDFGMGDGEFDMTKIPDIYDCIRFDMHHNQWISRLPFAQHMYLVTRSLAEIVVPLEYGIAAAEKMSIAQGICSPLLWKIRADLNQVTTYTNPSTVQDTDPENGNRLNPRYEAPYGKAQDGRSVRSRLYFTSESHIHSLVNMLRFGGLFADGDAQWARAREFLAGVPELNFLTQIVIMLYEDTSKEPESDHRFHVEIHFSPGMIDKGGAATERDSLKNGVLSRRNSTQQQQAQSTSGVVDALALEEGKKASSMPRQASYPNDMVDSSSTINYPKTKRDGFLSKVMESGLVTNKIFSTAVIQGINADMANATTDLNDETMNFRVPNVRPLETLHNALSFKQLDVFLRAILEGSRPAGTAGTAVEHSKSIDASAPSLTFSGELSESWTMEHVSDRSSDTSQVQPVASVVVPQLPPAPSPVKDGDKCEMDGGWARMELEESCLQVRLRTQSSRFAIADIPYFFPTTTTRTNLNNLVYRILKQTDPDHHRLFFVNFDFFINGHILLTSLGEYVQQQQFSSESEICTEYVVRAHAPVPERWLEHPAAVSAVDSTEDNILTGAYEKAVRMWDSSTGELVFSHVAHTAPIKAVCWVTSRTFLTASHDQTTILWSHQGGGKIVSKAVFRGHANSVDGLSLSPDSFVRFSSDETLKIWSLQLEEDYATGEILEPACKKLKGDGNISLTMAPEMTLAGHTKAVSCCGWTGKREVMTGSWDHSTRIWDVELGRVSRQLDSSRGITSLSYSPLNGTILAGSAKRRIHLYDPRSPEESVEKVSFLSHRGLVSSVCWSPHNQHLFVSGSNDKTMKVWDTRSPKASLYAITDGMDKVLCCTWTDKDLLLWGGWDNQLKTFVAAWV